MLFSLEQKFSFITSKKGNTVEVMQSFCWSEKPNRLNIVNFSPKKLEDGSVDRKFSNSYSEYFSTKIKSKYCKWLSMPWENGEEEEKAKTSSFRQCDLCVSTINSNKFDHKNVTVKFLLGRHQVNFFCCLSVIFSILHSLLSSPHSQYSSAFYFDFGTWVACWCCLYSSRALLNNP